MFPELWQLKNYHQPHKASWEYTLLTTFFTKVTNQVMF